MSTSEILNSSDPTLIIGLGGTGVNTIRYLKQKLKGTFGGRLPSHIKFLGIDTSDQDRGLVETLDPQEFVYVYVDKPRTIVEHMIHGTIHKWWPKSLPKNTVIMNGASQVRARGRLAFFVNIDKIDQAIRNQLDGIRSINQSQNPHQNSGSRPTYTVYVICSLCGGTGSGMFLDVSLLVRKHLRDYQGEVKGYFALPGVFSGEDGTKYVASNAYAAMTELDYLMEVAKDEPFSMRYSDDLVVHLDTEPFNYVYLLDKENEAGRIIKSIPNMNKVMAELVASQILDFGKQEANTKDRVRNKLVISGDSFCCVIPPWQI